MTNWHKIREKVLPVPRLIQDIYVDFHDDRCVLGVLLGPLVTVLEPCEKIEDAWKRVPEVGMYLRDEFGLSLDDAIALQCANQRWLVQGSVKRQVMRFIDKRIEHG